MVLGSHSGATLVGALKVQGRQGDDEAVVVTILCGDNKKYRSTGLMREEALRPGYLSPQVELLSYEVIAAPGKDGAAGRL